MNDLTFIAMLCTSGLINLSSFDDALIDLLAFGIARSSLARRRALSAQVPTVGVFVANWHEEDVLARMVEGNLARIAVPTVRLYLGVYPKRHGDPRRGNGAHHEISGTRPRDRQYPSWPHL